MRVLFIILFLISTPALAGDFNAIGGGSGTFTVIGGGSGTLIFGSSAAPVITYVVDGNGVTVVDGNGNPVLGN